MGRVARLPRTAVVTRFDVPLVASCMVGHRSRRLGPLDRLAAITWGLARLGNAPQAARVGVA